MLLNTFRHIQGIGPAKERALWAAGFLTWQDLVSSERPPPKTVLSARLAERTNSEIARDLEAFMTRDVAFLANRFKSTDHWKFYRHFPDRTAFLDIETTGMDPQSSIVTVIGLYQPDRGARVFIDGFNLERFPQAIEDVDILVTFNGNTFDLPFLRNLFPDARLPPASIDLRWLSREIGLKGGLKEVERQIGIFRHVSVYEFTGAEAVYLWRQYQSQDNPEALELLVRYNLEDTVNLHRLLVHCINEVYRAHPYLGLAPLGIIPTTGDLIDLEAVIDEARG